MKFSFSFLVLILTSGLLSASDLKVYIDRVSERSFIGQVISLGIFLDNQSEEQTTVTVEAQTDLPATFFLDGQRAKRYSWAKSGMFANKSIVLGPGKATILKISPFERGWFTKDGIAPIENLEFEISLKVSANEQVETRSVSFVAEEPRSANGKKILERFLSRRAHYSNISHSTAEKLLPHGTDISVVEKTGEQLESEYSELMVASVAVDLSLRQWHQLAQDGSRESIEGFYKNRGVAFGDPDCRHPAVCLAINVAGLSNCKERSICEERVRACAAGNEFFEGLAEYLIAGTPSGVND